MLQKLVALAAIFFVAARGEILKYRLHPKCGLFPWEDPVQTPPCPHPPNEAYEDGMVVDDDAIAGSLNVFLTIDTDKETSRLEVKGKGFPLAAPVTIWIIHCWPLVPQHPLCTAGFTRPVSPFFATTDGATNGRGHDPNTIGVDKHGNAHFDKTVDYNLFKPNSIPIIGDSGSMHASLTQQDYPASIGDAGLGQVEFTNLRQETYMNSGAYQAVAREFLREFNPDGSQMIDESTGMPVLVRSPGEFFALEFVIHPDRLTHGFASDIFRFATAGDFSAGDHYPIFRMKATDFELINGGN